MLPFFVELIITAGGENIAPVPIEDAIKEEVPIISNAMVIGDKRKFLSCFLTLKVSTQPLAALSANTVFFSLCDQELSPNLPVSPCL